MGMKKLLAVLFSALLLVGVAGCGGNNAQQGAVTQKVMNAKTKQDFEPVTEIKEGRKNVYAVLKVMKGNYWEDVIRGIKDGAAKADVNVYVGGVMKDGDWELQRDMVKELPGKKSGRSNTCSGGQLQYDGKCENSARAEVAGIFG